MTYGPVSQVSLTEYDCQQLNNPIEAGPKIF